MSSSTGPRPSTIFNRYSFDFDGTDDYVEVADVDNLSFGNGTTDSPFSISVWVKMTDSTRFYILNKGLVFSTNYEYLLNTNASDKIGLFLYDSSNNSRIGRLYNTALTSYENQWVHICSTYNGSGLSSGIKVYLNGVRVDDTDSNSGTYVAMENGNRPLNIGRTETALYSNGNIDETAVFNTELSQSDITTIYNGGKPNDILSLSPTSWWRMGDNATWNGSNWSLLDSKPAFSRKSVLLDGVDDYVDCGSAPFNSLSALSISAWVKPSAYGSASAESFVSTDASSPRAFYFGVYTSGRFRFSMSTNGANLNSLDTGGLTVDLNTWQHVLVTWDKVNTKFYKNGVLIATKATSFANNQDFTTTNDLLIGARRSSAGFFDGNIDEVSIYNVALTQADVDTIYGSGVPSDVSTISGITNWYRCGDNDTSPTLTDNVGSNNGTMTNFSAFSTEAPTLNNGTSTNMTEDSRKLSTTQFDRP